MFEDPDFYQFDGIFEETIKDCIQRFHRLKYIPQNKVKFVRWEIGEGVAYFEKTNG